MLSNPVILCDECYRKDDPENSYLIEGEVKIDDIACPKCNSKNFTILIDDQEAIEMQKTERLNEIYERVDCPKELWSILQIEFPEHLE